MGGRRHLPGRQHLFSSVDRWAPIGGKGDTLYYFGSGDTRPRILLGGAPNRRCSTAAHDACLLPVTRVSEQFVPLHLRVSHFLSVCLTGCAFDTFVRLYPSSDPHTSACRHMWRRT